MPTQSDPVGAPSALVDALVAILKNGNSHEHGGDPFPPLNLELREVVPTDCAAFHLNRRPQTLRVWACLETGPIRPIRINGRLAWPVAELRRLLEVSA